MKGIPRVSALRVGIALTVSLMLSLWLFGIYQIDTCTQTCSRLAPLQACRFSCNLESSWPFIYAAEGILLAGLLVLVVGRHLVRRAERRSST